MKLILAAAAAGITLALACTHLNTAKIGGDAMDIGKLSACTFYGEISTTKPNEYTQLFYAGELTDKETTDLVLDFVKQGEEGHKLELDESSVITEDACGFKIRAKDGAGGEYTLATAYLTDKDGGTLPVVVLKNGGSISCYADEHSYYFKSGDWEEKKAGFSDMLGVYLRSDLAKEQFKTGEKKYTPNTEKTDIVLLRHYTNGAWYRADEGTFVDMNGNIYDFNYSSEDFSAAPYDDLMTELKKIYADPTAKPIGAYPDTEALKVLSSYADKIDPDAQIDYEMRACDAGQNTTYLITSTGTRAFVYSEGDSYETSSDRYADMAHTITERMR